MLLIWCQCVTSKNNNKSNIYSVASFIGIFIYNKGSVNIDNLTSSLKNFDAHWLCGLLFD